MMMQRNSVYAQTARFDSQGRALTEDELFKLAPSIFQTEAHDSRSERFRPIATIETVRALMKEGFSPVGARQAVARMDDRRDYTKHMIRFRRMDGRSYNVGDTVHEIILKNANDGSSAYDLMSGLFRVRCLNSLVTQTSTLDSIKVRHSGDVVSKVIEGTYRVVNEAERALEAPQKWGAIALKPEENLAFAEAAHVLRFADAEGNITTPVQPAQLLRPRRVDDQARDLWTTFNVVQENVIRGGLTARGRDANGRSRRSTTRPVNGIDQDVKLNKALWVLAQKMGELKAAA